MASKRILGLPSAAPLWLRLKAGARVRSLQTAATSVSAESAPVNWNLFSSPIKETIRSRGGRHFSANASPQLGRETNLRRAGTLLLNDPPPPYEVSVHHGLKVQASLMLQRLPTEYEEPLFEKEFREFKLSWERRTGHAPVLSDEITFMQFPFQFLETKAQEESREKRQQETGDAEMSEIDRLLQQEGLPLKRSKRDQESRSRKQETQKTSTEASHGPAYRSLERHPRRILILLVKYGSLWQLPVEDRIHGQSMRKNHSLCSSVISGEFPQTLTRLCKEQLGLKAPPFFVGYAPAAFRKIRTSSSEGIQGREVFFYRAYVVPGRPSVELPIDSPVSDFAWVTQEEAREKLCADAFAAIRSALPVG